MVQLLHALLACLILAFAANVSGMSTSANETPNTLGPLVETNASGKIQTTYGYNPQQSNGVVPRTPTCSTPAAPQTPPTAFCKPI